MLKRYIAIGIFFGAIIAAPNCFARNPAGFRPAPLGLFGISIGSAWNLPTCEDGRDHAVMCSKSRNSTPDTAGLLQFEVNFPSAVTRPRYLKYENFDVGVRNGIIQEITIFTTGVDEQTYVLAELTVKFGEATRCKRSIMQNGFGAKFDTADCSWSFKYGSLEFMGVFEDTETGVIVARTREQEIHDTVEPSTTPRL